MQSINRDDLIERLKDLRAYLQVLHSSTFSTAFDERIRSQALADYLDSVVQAIDALSTVPSEDVADLLREAEREILKESTSDWLGSLLRANHKMIKRLARESALHKNLSKGYAQTVERLEKRNASLEEMNDKITQWDVEKDLKYRQRIEELERRNASLISQWVQPTDALNHEATKNKLAEYEKAVKKCCDAELFEDGFGEEPNIDPASYRLGRQDFIEELKFELARIGG